jgi:hypothetical protein
VIIPFYPLILGYAMATEHLFDIDLAFHYFVTWALSLGTALILILFSLTLSAILTSHEILRIILGATLTTAFTALFPWYFPKYEDWSNEFILHHKYDYFDDMPPRIIEWPKYLHAGELKMIVEKDFTEAMKFETAKIYLSGEWAIGSHKAGRYFFDVNPDNLDEETDRSIPADDVLIRFAEEQEGIIFLADLKKELIRTEVSKRFKKAAQNIIETMRRQSLEVIIPFFTIQNRPKYLLGLVLLGRWFYKDREAVVDKKDRVFFQRLAGALGIAFSHSLKNRFMEIAGEKKDDSIKDMIGEIKKLDKEKTDVEKEMAEVRAKASRFMKMSSEFATKIQMINEDKEELDLIMKHMESGVLTVREGTIKTANRQAKIYLAGTGRNAEGRPFEEVFTDQFKNTSQSIKKTRPPPASPLPPLKPSGLKAVRRCRWKLKFFL